MKENLLLMLGILLAYAASEPLRPPSWRTSNLWQQPQKVQAHSGLTVVNPPQFSTSKRFSRRGGPLPGYLPLRPVPLPRHGRWYQSETAPKPTYLRPPPEYERFPPFWSEEGPKHSKHRRPPSHRQAKKDCNPCNSVPWTPIFKSPRELVPHIEVYPESSIQQNSIVAPQTLSVDLSPPAIIDATHQLVSLPVGNHPVSPDLLLHHKPSILEQPIIELNPQPPIHHSVPFHPDTLTPPKESSNVVVTISEPDAPHPQDVHLLSQDQHSDSSSLVNSHSHQNLHNHQHGGLDIVQSVPLAEYTSSIQYPLHFVQSPPYIDIDSSSNSQAPADYPYEKAPKTGNQKVSDFILGAAKDLESGKNSVFDNSPSGSSKVHAHSHVPENSTKEKATRLEQSYQDALDPNTLTAPPLPPHLTQLLPTFETSYLHPLYPVDNGGVASAVNGALLPQPLPQPMNPTTLQPSDPIVPPKKIQIIIPYTTSNNQEFDQNALGSGLHLVNHSKEPERFSTWPPIVVNEPPQNQPRKVPQTQDFNYFKAADWNNGQASEANQVQHILAANIRDLLSKEMEAPKQNIRLQKNIDNWTALEYSNHKIVGKKHPGDLISHAQAVTSIPGTSISHLLLPSKKIPEGYFTTALTPKFDEPTTTPYPAVSVDSQPFTTVSRYSSVAWSGPTIRRNRQTTTPLPDEENEIPEETTPGVNWSELKVSIAPGTKEKVYVVTPVSNTNWASGKRSTRHIDTTEKYNPEDSKNALFTKLEKVSSENVTESAKNKPLHPKSTPLFRVKANRTRYEKISKFNKPKPIEKFFATTTKPLTQDPTQTSTISTSTTSTTPATFPFRNGGELPVEMAQSGLSSSQLTFKNTGERKTLIKQIKTNNRQGKEEKVTTTTLRTTSSSHSELTKFFLII